MLILEIEDHKNNNEDNDKSETYKYMINKLKFFKERVKNEKEEKNEKKEEN
jgi:hypothetical protein